MLLAQWGILYCYHLTKVELCRERARLKYCEPHTMLWSCTWKHKYWLEALESFRACWKICNFTFFIIIYSCLCLRQRDTDFAWGWSLQVGRWQSQEEHGWSFGLFVSHSAGCPSLLDGQEASWHLQSPAEGRWPETPPLNPQTCPKQVLPKWWWICCINHNTIVPYIKIHKSLLIIKVSASVSLLIYVIMALY